MKSLEGRVAVVAGATRGAGRGIACMLGEAGAVVYCSGRNSREQPNTEGYYAGRPETIEETAEMVSARGGVGLAARTDHSDERQVEALFKRVSEEQGRLDVLVNDISEGVEHEWKPFWKLSLGRGLGALRQGIDTHIITTRHAAPLMVRQKSGLVVEIGDGDALYYRGHLFYDLVKVNAARLAYAWAEELRPHKVAALYVTPGFMRTELVLERLKATEENWREVAERSTATAWPAPSRPTSSAAPSPRWPPTRRCWRSPAASTAPGRSPTSTASTTSTARARTGGATSPNTSPR
jgi:NAD(P)-dependent dehydrogenase (short-subunit alcohol dehydrogenase family)